MKHILTFIFTLFIAISAVAQSPELMSYQAVVRNAEGKLLIEKPVGIRIKILFQTENGASVYTETHTATTNKNGLVSIKIGAGTIELGKISEIDWSYGPYYLQTEMDPDGGNKYSISNTSQMLSVPYALYAKNSGNAWSLTGNGIYSDQFIGTINNRPLVFKFYNKRAGILDSSNVFWGINAGVDNISGTYNIGIGYQSLNKNEGGSFNVANGYQALHSNINGIENVAVGASSLYSNTKGNYNSAFGVRSLKANTIGQKNTAIGISALSDNTEGNDNVAAGLGALSSNTTGNYNSAYGNFSLSSSNGKQNVGIGFQSLLKNTDGSYNSAFGNSALLSNKTGLNNTAVGYLADVGASNLINATAIGAGAIVNSSNNVRIGNYAVTKIEGQVAFSFPSDARFKYNIQHNVPGLDFIKKLQPVTYYFDNEKLDAFTQTGVINNDNIHPVSNTGEKEVHTGFLAQDVEKTANELGYHFDGVRAPSNDKDHYSLAYSQFIMPLVKGMQEQQVIIDAQNKSIAAQNKINDQQDKSIEALKNVIKELERKISKLSKDQD
ncbi:MAG: tail fiber domain-containing protein [Ginsengibacter sp.]